MCGIFAIAHAENDTLDGVDWSTSLARLQPRGPDHTQVVRHPQMLMGFHRLMINGLSETSHQPMENKDVYLICNGEIYNHHELEAKYAFSMNSESDCEVILHLYHHLSQTTNGDTIMHRLCNELDGEFAFVLYDKRKQRAFAARDPHGVRPLFTGYSRINERVYLASEVKGFPQDDVVRVIPFQPGTYMTFSWQETTVCSSDPMVYHSFPPSAEDVFTGTEEEALARIQHLFTRAVHKRVQSSDRKVCGLLSGGLDSSLVCAIAAKQLPPNTFETFSIGIKGSTDLMYAKMVADHIQSKHTQVELTKEDFLNAIQQTITTIESFDTTSVRASVGNFLVAKYIREHTENKVVLNGDYSDEVCGGYLYLKQAPDAEEFHKECCRLVNGIFLFDSLRSDRTISSQGLEARTPFSDKAFIAFYMSLPPEWRMSKMRIEKCMLRKAFEKTSLLPEAVLWRKKEAFSDGVSNPEESWHKIITHHVDHLISDEEFEHARSQCIHLPPQLKETYFYRKIFEKEYGCYSHDIVKYYWLPRFCGNIADPSAREIGHIYESSKNE
jgi:asparagine synthase (glutamine-hydrolysing)